MTDSDFSVAPSRYVSSTSSTEPDPCDLCGYPSTSEMCPACGGSPAAAKRLEEYRMGGN